MDLHDESLTLLGNDCTHSLYTYLLYIEQLFPEVVSFFVIQPLLNIHDGRRMFSYLAYLKYSQSIVKVLQLPALPLSYRGIYILTFRLISKLIAQNVSNGYFNTYRGINLAHTLLSAGYQPIA